MRARTWSPAAGCSSSTGSTRRAPSGLCLPPPASPRPFRFPTWPASRASPAVELRDNPPEEHSMSAEERIRQQVTGHPVVLYMKGSPQQPMCGFSATATQLLNMSGAGEIFTVDVLQDPEIREGIKRFANWPTIPQLYVNGEFVGGCDIMREMHQSGELQQLLNKQPA